MTIRKSASQPSNRAPHAAIGWRGRYRALLLAVLLALTLALAPRAEAFVYWANPGSTEGSTGTIGRANLDGTGIDRSFIIGAGSQFGPAGVAVDAEHVYWANDATGTIGRANLDGTGVDPSFITVITDPTGGLCFGAVAVDAAHVYWGNDCVGIGRANLDGSGVDRTFIIVPGGPGPVAVDARHIYWGTIDGIGRANLDGTGVNPNFITGEPGRFPSGVAVDAAHVYWSYIGGPSGGGMIGRANLDGTGVDQSFIILRPPADLPGGVAVDAAHLYWNGGTIGRANLNGTGIDRNFISTKSPFGSTANGVAVDGLGPPPSNEFSFARVRKNEKKGTAKLTVKVPGPGTLKLARTENVERARTFVEVKGKAKLGVKPRGKAKQKLAANGEAKVTAEVTYTPDGGEPNTKIKKIKLVRGTK
jgi:hypothetical protein